MHKTLSILGATGTIGQNTLKVIRNHPEKFRVRAVTGGSNVSLLAQMAKELRPELVAIADEAHYGELKNLLAGENIKLAAGAGGVVEAAGLGADITMSAIVGAAGLIPTLAAIKGGKTIALANKECLVCAGELMQREIKKHGAKLIPVDSEHSGIFQLISTMSCQRRLASTTEENLDTSLRWYDNVERITITASGGPFREFTREQMAKVTPAQAVKHPNWNMGAKISVDSATLMNKGLELIEAFYLFPLRPEQFSVLVHPQSIIHALVEMTDGSTLAQLSNPDMCTPIAYALSHPERIAAPTPKLRLEEIKNLTFAAPDESRFPALALARAAMIAGGNRPTVLNAANEIAVHSFLAGKIGFLDIARIVEQTLEKMDNATPHNIEEVLACDVSARQLAESLIC